MPLADWTGRTRGEGFLEQLEAAAEELGLDGGVVRDAGIYRVPWRGGLYTVTVCHEDGSAALRAFSNVKFPPSGPPGGVVQGLMRWKTAAAYLSWDCHANADWSCFLIRCPIRLANFSARLLASSIDEALQEVAALDRLLAEHGYDRPGPRQVQAEGPRRLEGPPPAQSIARRVADAASRLLGGW